MSIPAQVMERSQPRRYRKATVAIIGLLLVLFSLTMLPPLFIGLLWAFSTGGKLFAYQSGVLVLGYAYGYFRHTDLIKIGLFLTVVDFVVLWLSVAFYWPLLGL